ncbi:MAG: dTDP-4-dehydrorhamnose 3,5-epimerase family protein [Acidimicrobiia bacterium]
MQYKVTDYYSKTSERSLRWDDPEVAVTWPLDDSPILSPRDAEAPALREAEVFS